MICFGEVPAGAVLPIPFPSYGKTNGESITLTGLAVTDIEVYKGTSVTQRASDAGYALIDTDGIDVDGITGIHGFSIDTGDNTDAGFYAVGSYFWVVVSAVTIDGQTVNFIAATFRIKVAESVAGAPKVDVSHAAGTAWGSGAITAAALGASTGIKPIHEGLAQAGGAATVTLATTAEASDDDLYNDLGLGAYIASGTGAGQFQAITDYVAGTRVATVDPPWVIVPDTTSHVVLLPHPGSQADFAGLVWAHADAVSVHTKLDLIDNFLDTEMALVLAAVDAEVALILADSNELQTDWANGGRLDLLIDLILADSNELQVDWVDGGRLDLLIDLIKAKTDSMTFTVANRIDSNVRYLNGTEIQGDGSAGSPWRKV